MSTSAIEITVFKGSKDGSIIEAKQQQPSLQSDEVLVKITHSGLCGTDVHYREADLVLGHEGTGRVEAIGPAVQDLKKYDKIPSAWVVKR